MISSSAFSYAKGIAGNRLAPMSMQSISMAERGSGIWNKMKKIRGMIYGMVVCRAKAMAFLRFAKMSLLSSTPSTMELKLSSSKSMSAAVLAISEPEPMAIPTSAF